VDRVGVGDGFGKLSAACENILTSHGCCHPCLWFLYCLGEIK
jgi:hypothetical protein